MSTKVAKQKPQATLKDMLQGDGMRKQFEVALPRHLTPERFIRVATTALLKTPQLADCNQASFFECLLALASHGLEPDGRRAARRGAPRSAPRAAERLRAWRIRLGTGPRRVGPAESP